METSAKDKKTAQEAESSTRTTKCASALMAKPGTEPTVLSRSHAAVENNGTTTHFNVIALLVSTGMEEHAFSVPTEKCGTLQAEPASVKAEPNGTASSAPSSKTVKEEPSGTRTPGHASALPPLSGPTSTVWPTLAWAAKFGTTSPRPASAQVTRSSLITCVYLLKLPASTVSFGTPSSWYADVLTTSGSTAPTASPFKGASTTRSTTPSSTSAAVLPASSSWPPSKSAATPLVPPTSVGMVSPVSISLAHPILSSMAPTVSAPTQANDAYPGNSTMVKSVFISLTPVPKVPSGTVLPVFPTPVTVPTATTNKETNASPSLNSVLPPLAGLTTDVCPTEPVLMVLSEKLTVVNPTLPVQVAKAGIQVSFNVPAPRELDGTERNVLSVLEVKSGTCKMAAPVLKAASWPAPDARNLLPTCAS